MFYVLWLNYSSEQYLGKVSLNHHFVKDSFKV